MVEDPKELLERREDKPRGRSRVGSEFSHMDTRAAPTQHIPLPAAAAEASAVELERICRFADSTSQLDPHIKPGAQLAELTRSIFQVETAAIFDADLREVYLAGHPIDELRDMLESICLFETSREDREIGIIRRVLRMGKLPIGALLLRGELSALTAGAVASVISITFDRYHAFANESRTETARRTEQMRTMVLDSLAHAYKTPLTAIAAASSGLAAISKLSPQQAELLSLIDSEANQLSQLTTRLLRTARLDVSDLVPSFERVAIEPLLEDVAASLRDPLSAFSVSIALSREDLSLFCDRALLVTMLTHFVENATKYGEPGTTIQLRVVEKTSSVVLSVRNFGPVIPLADCERVFDRYFRCALHSSMAPGTGIGLSIVKRAALAHGGDVWVTSDKTRGTTFFLSIPHHSEGRQDA